MNAPLLEIRNLTIRYREGERQVTAVRDISFTLAPGGALAIVGESGSGKSSVAGAILDFLGPAAEITGTILFEDQDLARLTPARRRSILGRRIGAAWLPPGMAYAEDPGDGADPQSGTATDVDEFEAEAAEIAPTDAELPAFLTEGDAAGVALNGASAP